MTADILGASGLLQRTNVELQNYSSTQASLVLKDQR
jgi:hypothetical protein